MPGLLLWVASDLLLQGPSRALAWRLLHDTELLAPPAWLRPWLPAGAPFDRDPLALLLAGGATGLAALYLSACLLRARARVRAALLAAAFAVLVLLPSGLYMSVGFVTGRPFGQDGGVVQLPLALDRLVRGESPYGADYSDSMLGKQSRASAFWRGYGGNPILHHHAYLPGTHVLTLPPYLAARLVGLPFDPRALTLMALAVAGVLAAGFFEDAERRLSAAAVVALNPLVYWHQAFGANDMLFVALLLGAARLLANERRTLAGALLGLACATKQLAWPYAPFLLIVSVPAGGFRELFGAESRARLRGPMLAASCVFAAVVLPVFAIDPSAFFADVVIYNAGLGGDLYPFGGTPGIGFANLVLYAGGVHSLREPFPLAAALVLLVPLGAALVRAQLRRNTVGNALAAGSVLLLATIYFSRVPHPNYLISVATLLPLAALLRALPADAALVPLSLLALAVTTVERGTLQLLWQDARAAGLSSSLRGLWGALGPKGDPTLVSDPLGLALSATAAGLALAYASAAVLGAGLRARRWLCGLAIVTVVVLPSMTLVEIGRETGTVRAQETTLVPARPAREAWSPSFRLEPAARLEGRREASAGAALVASLVRAARQDDARPLGIIGLVVALVLASRLTTGSGVPLAWGLVALLPPAAFGTLFGSDATLWLAAILFVLAAAQRVSLLALRAGAALVGLAGILDAALLAAVRPVDLSAGVGLVNLASYVGLEGTLGLQFGLALVLLAAAAAAVWTWRRASSDQEALAGAALALLLASFFASEAPPFRLALPLALVALAPLVGRCAAPRTGHACAHDRRDA